MLSLYSMELSTIGEENRQLNNVSSRLHIWKLWFKFLPCLEISHVYLSQVTSCL